MLPLCFSAFFCFGVCLVLIGANQADIADQLGLDLARSGMLSAALAAGLGLGVVGAGPLFDRRPRRPLFVASTLLAAVALFSVEPAIGFPRLLATVATIGVGIGAYDTFINALVVERFGAAAARPMAVVHAGATAGAIAGPLAIQWLGAAHWSTSFRITGVAHLALAAWALTLRFPSRRRPAADSGAPAVRSLDILRSPALLPFAAIAFAYVGVEAALTLFAVPYAGDTGEVSDAQGRAAISALWTGLLIGRLTTAPLVSNRGATVLLVVGPVAALFLAFGVLAGAQHVAVTFAAVGLSLGCVYPVMIALAGHQFPQAPGTAAGLAAGAGAAGGFAIPWIAGFIGDSAGVSAAVGSLAFWCAAIGGGAAALRRRAPSRSRATGETGRESRGAQ